MFLLGNVCDTGDGFNGICGIYPKPSEYICPHLPVTSWLSPDGETPGDQIRKKHISSFDSTMMRFLQKNNAKTCETC